MPVKSQFLEETFCMIKPDGVRRGLVGEILTRFERVGLKIVAMKMVQVSPELAGQHYTYEDIAVRHGEAVRNNLIRFVTESPVVAFVVQGVNAIENVRKLCGATQPLQSAPGTIRGDYSHHTYALTSGIGEAVRNVIHASANKEDAQREVALWFTPAEILSYKTNDQFEHFFGEV